MHSTLIDQGQGFLNSEGQKCDNAKDRVYGYVINHEFKHLTVSTYRTIMGRPYIFSFNDAEKIRGLPIQDGPSWSKMQFDIKLPNDCWMRIFFIRRGATPDKLWESISPYLKLNCGKMRISISQSDIAEYFEEPSSSGVWDKESIIKYYVKELYSKQEMQLMDVIDSSETSERGSFFQSGNPDPFIRSTLVDIAFSEPFKFTLEEEKEDNNVQCSEFLDDIIHGKSINNAPLSLENVERDILGLMNTNDEGEYYPKKGFAKYSAIFSEKYILRNYRDELCFVYDKNWNEESTKDSGSGIPTSIKDILAFLKTLKEAKIIQKESNGYFKFNERDILEYLLPIIH
ncbi:unnamed protein product [Blepharisma stoltei]|uniref:Uncharacterized protein n=1 Tax=Blepharisma stoltei TaxID=1481888 RepID=A0AAU9JNX4_9CILI|nr:unnamed protein product [Blepharisma stoltei]